MLQHWHPKKISSGMWTVCTHLTRWDIMGDALQHADWATLHIHHTQNRWAPIGQTFTPVFTVNTPVLFGHMCNNLHQHFSVCLMTPTYPSDVCMCVCVNLCSTCVSVDVFLLLSATYSSLFSQSDHARQPNCARNTHQEGFKTHKSINV